MQMPDSCPVFLMRQACVPCQYAGKHRQRHAGPRLEWGPRMEIVPSTLIGLALIALMLALGPYRGMVILMASAPFGMMAVINLPAVGNTSIVVLDLAVIAMTLLITLRRDGIATLARPFAPGGPGAMLILFLAYSYIATLFLPRIFQGETIVFSLGRIANSVGIVSSPLAPNNGNLSQMIRMTLSVMGYAVAYAVMRRQPNPDLALQVVTWATIIHLTLGALDMMTVATGQSAAMEFIRTANYALTLGQEMSGLSRVIGGFPEASSYSFFTMGMLGFWLSYWFTYRGTSRWPGVILTLLILMLIRGTSSSAYVAAGLLIPAFALTHMVNYGRDGVSRRAIGLMIGAVAALPVLMVSMFMFYELVPTVTEFLDRALLEKMSSTSGVERMSWNAQALTNLFDTFGLGAGLGSVRASNWLLACLGCTGIIGTSLILWFVLRILRGQAAPGSDMHTVGVVRALKWGCIGFLCRAVVVQGSPNLQIFFYVMAGLGAGLIAATMASRKALPRMRVPSPFRRRPLRLRPKFRFDRDAKTWRSSSFCFVI